MGKTSLDAHYPTIWDRVGQWAQGKGQFSGNPERDKARALPLG